MTLTYYFRENASLCISHLPLLFSKSLSYLSTSFSKSIETAADVMKVSSIVNGTCCLLFFSESSSKLRSTAHRQWSYTV